MKLQVIPSHFAKSCGGKWHKIMWSTMAEEVNIVNESMACFSQEGDQRGLENTDLSYKSYSSRAFAHAALVLWNSLPLSIRTSYSLAIFKKDQESSIGSPCLVESKSRNVGKAYVYHASFPAHLVRRSLEVHLLNVVLLLNRTPVSSS